MLRDEPAAGDVGFGEFGIEWVVEGWEVAEVRGERGLHLRTEELLLVLLLGFVAPAVEGVQRRAMAVGTVGETAVPHGRVGNDDGAGRSGGKFLRGMRRAQIEETRKPPGKKRPQRRFMQSHALGKPNGVVRG